MFETVRLIPPSREGIPLVTRAVNPIKNVVAPYPSVNKISIWQEILKSHPAWEIRKSPVGRYNCAGHIWGSRRTAIYDDDGEVAQIRSEDEYLEINESEVTFGDIVVYYLNDQNGGSFLHVAEVIEMAGGSKISMRVLSKFDDWGGEVCHAILDVPPLWGTPQIDFFHVFLREQ